MVCVGQEFELLCSLQEYTDNKQRTNFLLLMQEVAPLHGRLDSSAAWSGISRGTASSNGEKSLLDVAGDADS